MEYEGYTIEPVDGDGYKISVGEKVVAVGLPSEEVATQAILKRRAIRQRMGLNPVG